MRNCLASSSALHQTRERTGRDSLRHVRASTLLDTAETTALRRLQRRQQAVRSSNAKREEQRRQQAEDGERLWSLWRRGPLLQFFYDLQGMHEEHGRQIYLQTRAPAASSTRARCLRAGGLSARWHGGSQRALPGYAARVTSSPRPSSTPPPTGSQPTRHRRDSPVAPRQVAHTKHTTPPRAGPGGLLRVPAPQEGVHAAERGRGAPRRRGEGRGARLTVTSV